MHGSKLPNFIRQNMHKVANILTRLIYKYVSSTKYVNKFRKVLYQNCKQKKNLCSYSITIV